jgi:hypothetical protein
MTLTVTITRDGKVKHSASYADRFGLASALDELYGRYSRFDGYLYKVACVADVEYTLPVCKMRSTGRETVYALTDSLSMRALLAA